MQRSVQSSLFPEQGSGNLLLVCVCVAEKAGSLGQLARTAKEIQLLGSACMVFISTVAPMATQRPGNKLSDSANSFLGCRVSCNAATTTLRIPRSLKCTIVFLSVLTCSALLSDTQLLPEPRRGGHEMGKGGLAAVLSRLKLTLTHSLNPTEA